MTKSVYRLFFACVASLGLLGGAWAQDLRDRPVTTVVGFGPGGLGDIVARLVTNAMAASLGTPFVIENLPGAGGLSAASTVSRALPDGHTMLLVSGQNAASPSLFKSLPYDPASLAPVSVVGMFDFVFLVAKDSPFKTLGDMMEAAKRDPRRVNIGTISTGSVQNLAALLFTSDTHLTVQTVPFRTTGEVVSALLGGQIQVAVETVPGVIGQITSGQLRALAVSSAERSPFLKDVPTVAESGAPNYTVTSWNGFMIPAKTPAPIVQQLAAEVAKALKTPEVRDRMVSLGITPQASTPAEMQKIYDEDFARWRDVIANAKIQPQ